MYNFAEGEVLLVDKPYQWTSFDVVKKIKIAGQIKKIGHAGTLDPLATGLLILCTGKMTKQIDSYQAAEKEYTGTMLLGKTTPSLDLETPFDNEYSLEGITINQIQKNIIQFLGTIQQAPPIFSALKIDGERAYKKARRGDTTTQLAKRTLFIREFELTSIALPNIEFRLVCSKGTYVRSLARDFGIALGIGACLTELRRTRIGNFHVKNAVTPAEFVESLTQMKCKSTDL
jgi:tRNA pseudouridine55 synthase